MNDYEKMSKSIEYSIIDFFTENKYYLKVLELELISALYSDFIEPAEFESIEILNVILNEKGLEIYFTYYLKNKKNIFKKKIVKDINGVHF